MKPLIRLLLTSWFRVCPPPDHSAHWCTLNSTLLPQTTFASSRCSKNACLPSLGRRRWWWLLFTHHLTASFPVCSQRWIQIRGALWQGFLYLFCLIAVKRPPVASGPLLRRDKRLVEEGKQGNNDYFHRDPLPLMWAYNMEFFGDLKITKIHHN